MIIGDQTDDNGELEQVREAYRANPSDRDTALKLAQMYTDMGWLNEATGVYTDLVRNYPNDYSLILDYANLVFKRQNAEEALGLFRKLTVLRPERIEGWNNLGIVQLTLEDHDGARTSFSRVLELEPDNCGALLNLGNCHERKGNLDKAIELFERAVATRRDFTDGWYNLGNAYLETGKYQRAIEAFEKALRYRPEFASALKNLGFAHEKMEEFQKAEEYYLRALEHNKADAALYVNLATIYTARKLYDKAKDFCLRAVKLAPKASGGWMGLRHLSLLRGDVVTYVKATLAVLHRLEPVGIAESVRHLRQLGHFEEVDDILRQADRLAVQGEEIDAERLLAYQRTGTHAGKMAALARRIAALTNPSDPVRVCLASYYVAASEPRKAIKALDAVRERTIVERRVEWSALKALGRLDDARKSITEFLHDNDDCGEAWLHLAQIDLAQGMSDDAGRHLDRARKAGAVDAETLIADPRLRKAFARLDDSISPDDQPRPRP